MGARPVEACGKHREPRARQDVFDNRLVDAERGGEVRNRLRDVQQVLADELLLRIDRRVALVLHAVMALHRSPGARACRAAFRSAEQLVQLLGRPQIESAFRLVRMTGACGFGRDAVGVLGRKEAAVAVRHLAKDVVQRVFGDVQEAILGKRLRAFHVREDQLCLVVQHLLEVRHAPGRIDRVPVESAADMVAHAAERHRQQRRPHHPRGIRVAGPCVLAQEKEQLARPRKLRRASKAAVPLVERLPELRNGPLSSAAAPGGVHAARGWSPARSCAVTASAESTTFSRSALHTRAISWRISANPGLPHFDDGGK